MPGFNSGASGFCLRVPRISLHSGKEKQQRRQLYVSLQRNASTEMNKMRLVFWDCHRRDSLPVHPVGTSLSISISIITPHPALSSPHRLVGVARSALRSLRKATRNDIQIEQGVFLEHFFFRSAPAAVEGCLRWPERERRLWRSYCVFFFQSAGGKEEMKTVIYILPVLCFTDINKLRCG